PLPILAPFKLNVTVAGVDRILSFLEPCLGEELPTLHKEVLPLANFPTVPTETDPNNSSSPKSTTFVALMEFSVTFNWSARKHSSSLNEANAPICAGALSAA